MDLQGGVGKVHGSGNGQVLRGASPVAHGRQRAQAWDVSRQLLVKQLRVFFGDLDVEALLGNIMELSGRLANAAQNSRRRPANKRPDAGHLPKCIYECCSVLVGGVILQRWTTTRFC